MDLIAVRSVNFATVPPTYTTVQGTVHPLLLPQIVYEDDQHLIVTGFTRR